jgi:tetratricopeptide (TPR) repeat protein
MDSLRNLGILYYSWRKYEKAREFLERALQVAGGKPMGNDSQHDEGISTLGLTYEALGFPEKALSLYAGALKVKEKASGLQRYRMLPALNDYGTLCFRLGCDTFTLPLESPGMGFLSGLPQVLVPLALLEESGRIFERGSDIAFQFPAQAYPDSMTTVNYFTEFLIIAGRYDEAESHYRNIAGSYKKTFGADHLNTANLLSQFAVFYSGTGKTGEALTLMKEVIRIYHANGLGNDIKITGSLRELGRIYLARGEYAEGLSEFKKMLAILENVFGTEAIQISNDVYEIADIYRRMGMNPEAGTWYLRALKIWDSNTQGDQIDSVAFLRDISEKLRLTGNKQWRKLNTRVRAVLRKEAQKKLLNN